ncbi:Retrovirus-related Pol polyprotein type-2 like protein [Argiope bruennichi]|uniref:Retrovirus-related Pol polyprotein type-2 like protein n=1 Tax=Argiope bruennichi TaxID=94029 RepID=A0A8T0EUJ7_ARGBR|nr:Retrovirus-related Pol polyprotein type-2 like protein [Argiope bruennichi]
MFQEKLHLQCDGRCLAQTSKVPGAHSWIQVGTSFLSGRDLISCIHVRLGVLYSGARVTRGRDKDHLCSRGCSQPETLSHIIQTCYSTHGARIQRHDAICKYLARVFGDRGCAVHEEPHFQTSLGVQKPDLVVYTPKRVLVLDVQVIKDHETNEVPEPWLRPKRLTPKPKFPMDKNVFISSLQKKVEEALKLVPAESFSGLKRKRPTWSEMKLGRKKRDFVDTILISEIKEEEPEWVNYDQDEVTVKFQIADSIFDYLVNDTVNLIKDLKKKSYLFIGNMT